MDDFYRDPYRPVVAIHVDPSMISLVYLTGGRLLFMRSIQLTFEAGLPQWAKLNSIFACLFPKVERIVLDNRPFNFLMNLYTEFKEHQWKFVFITNELLRYKFLRPLNENAVVKFADEWLVASNTAPEIKLRLQKHRQRVSLSLALLCYMTYVTPLKHESSNYRPTLENP